MVDIFEIPIEKFIVSLGLLRKTVQANEFIFLLCRRPVPASCIALVEYKSSFVDKLFSLLLCLSVKRHGHGCSPIKSLGYPRAASP